MYKFMLSIPKKAEKEKESEKKEKKANSIAIPSSQLLKVLGERLAEQEKKESKQIKSQKLVNLWSVLTVGGMAMKSQSAILSLLRCMGGKNRVSGRKSRTVEQPSQREPPLPLVKRRNQGTSV